MWELAAVDLATAGMPPGPPLVRICAVIGGPASVSAVAWWEIGRLRTRYGVTLRGGVGERDDFRTAWQSLLPYPPQ